jgi:hypothetical protein
MQEAPWTQALEKRGQKATQVPNQTPVACKPGLAMKRKAQLMSGVNLLNPS